MDKAQTELSIRPYQTTDENAVVTLWETCFPDDPPWNAPRAVIRQKLTVQPELFLVAIRDQVLVGTVLAGFDGFRGWVNKLATHPEHQRQGVAARLMLAAEDKLAAMGCVKLNLQVRAGNEEVVQFYEKLGYGTEPRISMGKRLGVQIDTDDLTNPQTLNLIHYHLEEMQKYSPPGSAHALDPSALRAADTTLWSARFGDAVAGIAALRRLSDGSGELKSMRTNPTYLRRGVASALLERIIEEAKLCNMPRLSLETGSGEAFTAALALYRQRGFIQGEAFGDYTPNSFNQFWHLTL